MISAGDFRNGVTLEIDGQVVQILEFQHVKPGKGAAFVRTKLKNVINGGVVERTFRPTEKFPQARIERVDMQYLSLIHIYLVPADGVSEEELLKGAFALEQKSEHPLARAILALAEEKGLAREEVRDFSALPGNGLVAKRNGKELCGGKDVYKRQACHENDKRYERDFADVHQPSGQSSEELLRDHRYSDCDAVSEL